MVVTMMIWAWTKMFEVRCPDGTKQYVYRNVDYVFPFVFKDAKMSTAAALEGLRQIRAKVSSRYDSQIKSILIKIDEKNASIQAHLRAAYVVYASAPCKKLDYLESAINEIRQDERDLRAAEVATRQLVVLLSSQESHTLNSDLLIAQFVKIMAALNYRTPAAALAEEMSRVAGNFEEWRVQ
jgi:hypothetical protein